MEKINLVVVGAGRREMPTISRDADSDIVQDGRDSPLQRPTASFIRTPLSLSSMRQTRWVEHGQSIGSTPA